MRLEQAREEVRKHGGGIRYWDTPISKGMTCKNAGSEDCSMHVRLSWIFFDRDVDACSWCDDYK